MPQQHLRDSVKAAFTNSLSYALDYIGNVCFNLSRKLRNEDEEYVKAMRDKDEESDEENTDPLIGVNVFRLVTNKDSEKE